MKLQRTVRVVLACIVVSAALTGDHVWTDLTKGRVFALSAYAGAGDKIALKTLMTEAQKGNPYAQFGLGVLYDLGLGIPQDHGQAAQWWRKAAQQGDADAQAGLGFLYRKGQGVPQDYGQAAQWYRKAAEQGNADAQFNLGRYYDNGQGVPQSYAQAAQWYRKVAQHGNANAQGNLGILYAKGLGVPQSDVIAYALWGLLATQDTSENGNISKARSLLAQIMTQQEIEAAQALSREMSRPGNLLKALDEYLAASAVKNH